MDSVPPSIPTTNSLLLFLAPSFFLLSLLFGESSSSAGAPPPPPRSMTTRGVSGVRWAGWEREVVDDDDDDDVVCGRNDGNIIARRRSVDVVVDGGRCVLFAIVFKAEVRQFGRRAIPSKQRRGYRNHQAPTSEKLHCHISRHCLIRIGFFLVGIKD
jgi:hypothetical protein